jgi:hypothetical protein
MVPGMTCLAMVGAGDHASLTLTPIGALIYMVGVGSIQIADGIGPRRIPGDGLPFTMAAGGHTLVAAGFGSLALSGPRRG